MTSIDDLVRWLDERQGVAHSAALRVAGFPSHRVAAAVRAGVVRRVRRSWVVSDSCDPKREAAARLGGRVTCVSAAELRGWWLPARDAAVHVAVPATASRLPSQGCRVHWSPGPAPAARDRVDDSVVNILFHVARCMPAQDAAAVWDSAIRKGDAAPQALERVQWRCQAAAEIAALSSALSDSGIETRFVWIMRTCSVRVAQQVMIDGHYIDALIGERLLVQLDGFEHHRAGDRRRDLEADARLVLRGYTVLRFDYFQVLFTPDLVRDTVLMAMAQGLHRAR